MNATIFGLHPLDTHDEMTRLLMVPDQLLLAIEAARDEHGDDWDNHIGHLVGEPVDVLIALAVAYRTAARDVARRVTVWGEEALPRHFQPVKCESAA